MVVKYFQDNYGSEKFNMRINFNQAEFQIDIYGDQSFSRGVVAELVLSDVIKPSWTLTNIQKNVIVDETDFIQLGQYNEVEFHKIEIGETKTSQHQEWPTRKK